MPKLSMDWKISSLDKSFIHRKNDRWLFHLEMSSMYEKYGLRWQKTHMDAAFIIVKLLKSCPGIYLFFYFCNFYVFKKQRAVQNNATPSFSPDSKSPLYKLSNDLLFVQKSKFLKNRMQFSPTLFHVFN